MTLEEFLAREYGEVGTPQRIRHETRRKVFDTLIFDEEKIKKIANIMKRKSKYKL